MLDETKASEIPSGGREAYEELEVEKECMEEVRGLDNQCLQVEEERSGNEEVA